MALRIANLSNDAIRRIVDEYLQPFITMEMLATRWKTTPSTISNILYKAVTNNIVDEFTTQAIISKVTGFTENVVRTRKRWEKALTVRNRANIQAEIEFKKRKLEELEFQYHSYDEYASEESGAPTKRSIWCAIGRIKGEIALLKKEL